LSDPYCTSPNCIVELQEAIKKPQKLTICVIGKLRPYVNKYLELLEEQEAKIVYGVDELIEELDEEICNTNDEAAYDWWRSQGISGAGVPSYVVPTDWTIDKYSLWGHVSLPERSIKVGPLYISGDCLSAGRCLALPWLFIIASVGAACNFVDMYYDYTESANNRHSVDYVWLASLGICNLAPFWAFSLLFETRADVTAALRPLLASKALNRGVKVSVSGDRLDPMVKALKYFIKRLGHLHEGKDGTHCITIHVMSTFDRRDEIFGNNSKFDHRYAIFVWASHEDGFGVNPTVANALKKIKHLREIASKRFLYDLDAAGKGPKGTSRPVQIKAEIEKIEKEIALESDFDDKQIDIAKKMQLENELREYVELQKELNFIYNPEKLSPNDPNNITSIPVPIKPANMNPAQKILYEDELKMYEEKKKGIELKRIRLKRELEPLFDGKYEEELAEKAKQQREIGQRMMKYLVLVAAWDGPSLANNLLSAVGTRVVDIVHEHEAPPLDRVSSF